MESVGFKEWAVVCEALGSGRQTIILRKGGIAEGRDGFSFDHREFFLFPTWFHEQPQKVRATDIRMPEQRDSEIEIKYAATLETSGTVRSWKVAEALTPFHILQADVVRERFDYDKTESLHIAFVRVYRVEPVWSFPNEKKYGGCRSWVNLPQLPNDTKLIPVLSDRDGGTRLKQFVAIVGAHATASTPM
jgi:hypothetical protein